MDRWCRAARGYWRRPELTERTFVWSQGRGRRYYRSGDLGFRRADGCIEFRGRRDGQAKLRGFRVEPGEVEAALARCPGVRVVAAAVRDNHRGEPTMVAWVEATGTALDADILRAYARVALPDYMVPSAWVHVPRMPLTVSGKLDRRALPDPAWEDRATYTSGTVSGPAGSPPAGRARRLRKVIRPAVGGGGAAR